MGGGFPKHGAHAATTTEKWFWEIPDVAFSHLQLHHETRCFQCFLESSVSFQRMPVFGLRDLCLLSHGTHFVIQSYVQTCGLQPIAASGSKQLIGMVTCLH